MNSVEVKSQQFYLESIGRALAASLVFHAALFVTSELSQHFRWWKKPAWSNGRLAEQKGALFQAAKKRALSTPAREVSILFDVAPPRPASVPSQPSKSVPAKADTKQPEKPAELKEAQVRPVLAVPPPVAPALAVEPQPIPKEPAVTPNERRSPERDPIAADSSTKLPTPLAPATDSAPGPHPVPEEATVRETPGVVGAAEPGYAPPIASAETVAPRRPSIEIDLRGTRFGTYDSKIISAVQRRWYELLDERKMARGDTGRVIVEFRLKYDGNISELNIARREVDFVPAWICQRAIADSAPFAPWPREMRHSVAASFRSVRFTFVY